MLGPGAYGRHPVNVSLPLMFLSLPSRSLKINNVFKLILSYLNKKRVEKENITFSFNLIISNPEAKEYIEFSLCLMFQVRASKGLGNPGSA